MFYLQKNEYLHIMTILKSNLLISTISCLQICISNSYLKYNENIGPAELNLSLTKAFLHNTIPGRFKLWDKMNVNSPQAIPIVQIGTPGMPLI